MIAASSGAASRILVSDFVPSTTCIPFKNCHPELRLPLVSPGRSKGTIKYRRSQPRLTGFMYEVTVEDTFAAGHYLRNYKGKCENPHGHNYKIRVTLAGAELDKAGLLLDFKDLREVMRHVIDRLDHQMINEIEPFTAINPSAENLAKYFYDESNGRLQSVTSGRVRVKDVTVYETDTTTAKYSEP